MDCDISSDEGANKRVFVGNLPSEITSKTDLINKFKRYGKVLGVAVHRGFAFVQFSAVREAEDAIKGETNTLFRGKRIDCNIASDRKRGPRHNDSDYKNDDRNRRYSRDRDRGPSDYSKNREFDRYPEFTPRRDRSPLRDSFDDSFRDRAPLRRDEPPRRDRDRDPYFDDAPRGGDSRREPPEPYGRRPRDRYEPGFRDDPYREKELSSRDHDELYRLHSRRDPYDRDYDRRLPPAPAPAPTSEFENPIDAEILVVDKQQRGYAEIVERRLKEQALNVGMIFLSQELTLIKALEDVTRRDVLYAIVITSQHELHRSVTLNILHGTPQEHRNMPLEDAMKLVVKNFDSYMQALRDKKGEKPVDSKPAVVGSEALDELTMPQLLNLLADGRQLTIPELTRVINYLTQIRLKMMGLEGITPTAVNTTPAPAAATSNTEDLQAKILNTISSAGGITNAPPTKPKPSPLPAPTVVSPPKTVEPKPKIPISGGDMPHVNLNLDNPNIQKALNSLIQIKPGVLRSLVGSTVTETTPTMATANSSKSLMPVKQQPPQNQYEHYQPNPQQQHQQFLQEQQQHQQQQQQQQQFNQQQQQMAFPPQQQQQQQMQQQQLPPQQQQQPQPLFNGPVGFSFPQQQSNFQQLLQQQFYGMSHRY